MKHIRLILVLAIITQIACKQTPGNTQSNTSSTPSGTQTTTDDNANANTAQGSTPATSASAPHDEDIMTNESIGNLKINLTAAQVLAELGKPTEQSKPELWGADGAIHQTWSYKNKGIDLDMAGEKGNDPVLNSISITQPCMLKTKANIGIGNSYAEVLAAYKNNLDTEMTDTAYVVVGTVYGGLMFSLRNQKVESIFLGAAAE